MANGLLGHPVLREIQQQIVVLDREAREALGISLEKVAKMDRLQLDGMIGQGAPGGQGGRAGHQLILINAWLSYDLSIKSS